MDGETVRLMSDMNRLCRVCVHDMIQGSFPKKSLWERRVRVPKVQGSRCVVWRGSSAPLPNFGS